jgi:hypothetical protein
MAVGSGKENSHGYQTDDEEDPSEARSVRGAEELGRAPSAGAQRHHGIRQTPEWLGARVGYKVPSSMRQVINGHQGVSQEVYNKILKLVPEMKPELGGIKKPPITKKKQGRGAYGHHKVHDYPKTGPVSERRAE